MITSDTDLLKYLSKRYQEEQKILADDLALGKAKDHGDYKYACGIIRGLLIANNVLIETTERIESSND